MNCKPGDLAVIVRAMLPENLGRVVKCIRVISEEECRKKYKTELLFAPESPIWEVEGEVASRSIRSGMTRSIPIIRDYSLLPIQPKGGQFDSEKEDERIEETVESTL